MASSSLDRRMHRAARERAQPVAIEIGQDRIEPTAYVAAVKQVLRTQGAHQRVLHQVVGDVGIAGERARVTAQCRDRRLDVLPKSAQG